jgi:hypothetical protein
MADKKKTSELTANSSPSTSATLVGVDNGETVQIPITEFVTKDENGGVHIRTKQGKNSIEVCETEDESYTVIQSNALQLHGVSTLRTYDDKEGKDGQFLTKKDGLVIWGDIPSLDGLASTSYVDTKVAGIVNSAPAALDTLNELSKALGNDANFSATVATQIGNKVDKENGKGLSTNDYTTAEKNKLAGIAEGANKYIHPDTHPASMITGLSKVATSGSYNDLTDKPTIPSGGGSGGASFIECETLPTENYDTNVIYATTVEKIEAVQGGAIAETVTVEMVDELPEVGVGFVNVTTYATYIYYLRSDARMYVYLNDELASMFGASVGWHTFTEVNGGGDASLAGSYIYSIEEATDASKQYFLFTKPRLYRFTTSGKKIEILTHNSFGYNPYDNTFTLIED